jgi:hypothetical protein
MAPQAWVVVVASVVASVVALAWVELGWALVWVWALAAESGELDCHNRCCSDRL